MSRAIPVATAALAHSHIRERTGCSVVAIETDGAMAISPPAEARIPAGSELILIGTPASGQQFREAFVGRTRR